VPITLSQIVEWARPFVSNLLLLSNETGLEPALTNANMVLSVMLGPPFVWEWNRSTANFTFTANNTDAVQTVADYGFIETAYIQVPSGAPSDPGTIYQLQLRRQLEKTTQPGRPGFLSVFNDDGAGNITVRLGDCSPDLAYTATITYQQAPAFVQGVGGNIPVPAKFMHIFRYGFLAMAYMYNQDFRLTETNQKFVATLLGAQNGLDEAQRNIFLGNWYSMISDQTAASIMAQQGATARGNL
jgi:hypothetical protein